MAQALDQLVEAGRAPLAEWGARYPGRRPVGTLCSYVPEEMIHAAGLAPVRVRGSSAPIRLADAHLQSFACALCRSSLDQALSGALGPTVGTVFAHTCDAMQALADLWRIHTPTAHFVDVVMLPANLSSPAARPYLVAELGRFRERLAGFVGRRLGEDDLRSSIALYDETRRLVQSLQAVRDRLTAPHFFAVLDAAQAMPRETFNPLLAEVLAELATVPAVRGGPRLFVSGATLDEPQVLELIEGLGARVAGDDLCSGSRHFLGQVGAEGNPLENLAEYALRRRPCPTKLQAGHDPGESAVDQAREARADGIVFVIEKFCEPHAFDYALARPALERAGLPHLVLEMEQVTSVEGLRTRLQAFVEML
jgi:bzd-type benzoyl-CoA reductase N subunit